MSNTFIGKPCRTCGNTERYISGNKPCVVCLKKNSQKRFTEGKTTEWRKSNLTKANEYQRKRYHNLTEEEKKLRNRKQQLALYGLTTTEYDNMLREQNGVCAICGSDNPRGKNVFVIDHNHDTGEVRGLLCDMCNKGIGCLGDNLDKLRSAVLYLERYQS
tara:strand:+ start:117 stop:596 length:480 start_codon:yes stop_codon:yes gene_type:complete